MYHRKLIKLKCSSCRFEKDIHINDVYAKESKLAIIIAAVIFLGGTPLVIYLLYQSTTSISNDPFNIVQVCSLFLVPGIVYAIIHNQEQNRVNHFNRYKV